MTDDLVRVCPECGDHHISHRQASLSDPATRRYRCEVCGATFDDPHERERQQSKHSGNSPLTKRLSELDPDDVATDGGQPVADRLDAVSPTAVLVAIVLAERGPTTIEDLATATHCPRRSVRKGLRELQDESLVAKARAISDARTKVFWRTDTHDREAVVVGDADVVATDGGPPGDRWRLVWEVSGIEHRTEWTPDIDSIETLAGQYREDRHRERVRIESREVSEE